MTIQAGQVYAHECDVTDNKKVYSLAVRAEKEMGIADILINNAGIEGSGKFYEQPIEQWDQGIAVNLIFLPLGVGSGMQERKGRD